MEMNGKGSWIGKKVFLRLNVNEQDLVFTAIIISFDEQFITFTDKFNVTYSYKTNDIVNIKEEG